jgi:hypothetical protein
LSPFDIAAQYGEQPYDIKFIDNISMYYSIPYFQSQKGILGHILGGWTIAPIFTAQSGSPTGVSYSEGNCTGCEAFGEVSSPGVSGIGPDTAESAVGLSPYTGNVSTKYNEFFTGTNGNNLIFGPNSVATKTVSATNPGYGLNVFQNPAAVYSEFRPCVLGYDTSCGGASNLRGLPTWNLDANVVKDIGLYRERVSAKVFISITNALNHFQASGPGLTLTSPTTFGQITGQANTPRNMEFGIRLGW